MAREKGSPVRGEAVRQPRSVRTPKPTSRQTKSIGGLFPLAYLKIIEQEAGALGQSRSGFLTMLVRRQLGEILLERHPSGPTYQVDRKNLAASQHYVFYVEPELARRIEDEMLRMGNLSANAYVINLVNNWLGQPMGLKFSSEPKRKG
jgi:hypothetical protein